MGLRCSLLGHDYGDSEVEREREEQGSEVVVTIREEQTCSRCGKTKLVSENKEVTSLATHGDPDDDGSGGFASSAAQGESDVPGADDGAGEEPSLPDEADGHDAEIIDGGPDEDVPAATREAATVTDDGADDDGGGGEGDAVEPETAPDDDAVILDETDDDRSTGGRQRGEWPEPDDVGQGAHASGGGVQEWPDVDDEDEGFDAEPTSGEPADVEFGGGLAPESGGSVDGDERMIESAETGADTGFTSADTAPSPVEGVGADEETEFVCPECGHAAAGVGTSLRAGDICPECKKGYLAER